MRTYSTSIRFQTVMTPVCFWPFGVMRGEFFIRAITTKLSPATLLTCRRTPLFPSLTWESHRFLVAPSAKPKSALCAKRAMSLLDGLG